MSATKTARQREDEALEVLVALALRQDDTLTDEEIQEYLAKPVKLSPGDKAALKRSRPELLKALREELLPDAKTLSRGHGRCGDDFHPESWLTTKT